MVARAKAVSAGNQSSSCGSHMFVGFNMMIDAARRTSLVLCTRMRVSGYFVHPATPFLAFARSFIP